MLCCVLPYRLMETAKEMTRESLPIKCLEAVILGMYPLSYVCLSLLHRWWPQSEADCAFIVLDLQR